MEGICQGSARKRPARIWAVLTLGLTPGRAKAMLPPMHRRREQQSLEMHRRIALRLTSDPQAVLAKAFANLDAWQVRCGTDAPGAVLQEWRNLLGTMTPLEIAGFITSEDQHATRMRQSSPFAGVLTPREVWAIKRNHEAA